MIHFLISDIIITHSLTKSKQIIDLERLFFLFKAAVDIYPYSYKSFETLITIAFHLDTSQIICYTITEY